MLHWKRVICPPPPKAVAKCVGAVRSERRPVEDGNVGNLTRGTLVPEACWWQTHVFGPEATYAQDRDRHANCWMRWKTDRKQDGQRSSVGGGPMTGAICPDRQDE